MFWLWAIIVWVLEGALIGWIASRLMGDRMGFGMYFLVGIIGSMLGGLLASLLGINTGFWMGMLFAVIGSCILLWIVGRIRRA